MEKLNIACAKAQGAEASANEINNQDSNRTHEDIVVSCEYALKEFALLIDEDVDGEGFTFVAEFDEEQEREYAFEHINDFEYIFNEKGYTCTEAYRYNEDGGIEWGIELYFVKTPEQREKEKEGILNSLWLKYVADGIVRASNNLHSELGCKLAKPDEGVIEVQRGYLRSFFELGDELLCGYRGNLVKHLREEYLKDADSVEDWLCCINDDSGEYRVFSDEEIEMMVEDYNNQQECLTF